MIERYQDPTIQWIWSEDTRYDGWAAIEFAYLRARGIDRPFFNTLFQRASATACPTLGEMVRAVEKETRHDVAAFVRVYCGMLEKEERGLSREFHFRLTSSDLVDTWNAACIVRSVRCLGYRISDLVEVLSVRAEALQALKAVGRTHGQAALPIVFGDRFVGYLQALGSANDHLTRTISGLGLAKIGGPTGSEITEELERKTLANFSFMFVGGEQAPALHPVARPAGQCVDRRLYFRIAAAVLEVALVLDKIALDLRLLSLEEVGEVREGYPATRVGSSSMPHKRNPVNLEKVNGLVRVLRSNLDVFAGNSSLWLERDISHSSSERFILPDFFEITAHCLSTVTQVVNDLEVVPNRIIENLEQVREKMDSFERLHAAPAPGDTAGRMETYQQAKDS